MDAELLNRRDFLRRVGAGAALALPLLHLPLLGQTLKPGVTPIPEPHFPSRLFLFVWRNWELANSDRLAQVLNSTHDLHEKLHGVLEILHIPAILTFSIGGHLAGFRWKGQKFKRRRTAGQAVEAPTS